MIAPVTRPAATAERNLEAAFAHGVRLAGGMTAKITSPTRGVPDRVVLAPGGRMYLVELKTDTGRLSPVQRLWRDRARAVGVEVVVLSGASEIAAWIDHVVARRDTTDRTLARVRRSRRDEGALEAV